MTNIFRTIPDATSAILSPGVHLLIFIIFLLGFVLIKKYADHPQLEKLFIRVLIIHQLLLYGWYLLSGYHLITEGLPLYHCRIAILLLTIYYFTRKPFLAQLATQIGLFGSVLSISLFVPDPFLFPHITQFTYVVGHAFLGWYAWWLLLHINPLFTKSELRRNNLIILAINLGLIIVDYLLNANYGFFMEIPIIPNPQPLIVKQILLLIAFSSLTYFLGWLFMICQKKMK